MARITSPSFRLFTGSLLAALESGQAGRVTESLLPKLGMKRPDLGYGVPVALRWTTETSFALPRQPFRLYRRRKKYSRRIIVADRLEVAGTRAINSGVGELCRAEIILDLAPGQSLLIDALDAEDNPIPGTTVRADASGTYLIKSPFIQSLRFAGTGSILHIRGVVQLELVNAPDWELIQLVGFPFQPGEIAAPEYDPEPQGWPGALPMDGREFARYRLLIGQILHEDMPALPDPALPHPVWLAPDPASLLFELADTPDGLLRLVHECLSNTDDSSPNPQHRQQAYVATRTVQGLRQEGFPGTVEPAQAIIPVVNTTILAASTDNYASLALGYGTYDFPPAVQDDREGEGGYDYMVVNTYRVRPFEEGVFPFDFSHEVEFAALSESRPRPDRPSLLSVTGKNQNRPLSRDATTDESVQLQFLAPAFPQAYGIVKAGPGGHLTILNEERRFSPRSYTPHIPDIPNSENVPGATCSFTDPFSPTPLAGSENYDYFLAAVDLFGRWSAYDQHSYVAHALAPQRPGLIAARLRALRPLPAANPPDLPCEIEIEFSWDWTERSPEKIQIGGGFYPADRASPSSFTDRFAHHSSNAVLPLIEVTFSASGAPLVSGAGHSVVEVVPNNPAADPNIRRYKLTVSNVTAVFPGPLDSPAPPPAMNPSRVAYSVTARALEQVRAGSLPETWSDWVGPVFDQLDDPRPPVMVSLPATVNWTALPDATGIARGKLQWPSIDRASGYVVWEASETALREFLGLAQHPEQSYVDRATELETHLSNTANEINSLKAFVRLNRDPITSTSFEVQLPGAADTLYVYRVSALSSSNEESSRSNAVFFAVPRQVVPGQPGLKLETVRNGTTAGIRVIALQGAGPAPAGYKVYRVRKQLASNEVSMKGLPILQTSDPNWTPYQLANRDGSVTNGMSILDPISEVSWKPYYYQVVAVGPQDLAQGVLQGQSPGSPTQVTYFPPDSSPVLTLLSNTSDASARLLVFSSNVPLEELAIGRAVLEITRYESPSGAIPTRETLFVGAVSDLPRASLPFTLTSPPLPDLSAGPDIAVVEATHTFYVRLYPAIRAGIIKVIDPLQRTTQVLFETP
jgi:hypothetical protein